MRIAVVGAGGVGAVYLSTVGQFRKIPEARQMYADALHEITLHAEKFGVLIPAGYDQQLLKLLDILPENGAASMQRDIFDGRPSELESQNGAVVRLTSEAGIDAPVNNFIYSAMLPQELLARGLATS